VSAPGTSASAGDGAAAPTPFTAAMIQMRTGLSPEASFAQAAALIRQARRDGADYVQTPEMSNLMQENRAALFALLKDEEHDTSLANYRSLARELKVILHVGSLAVRAGPERAANRSFLIDASGEIVARYDKIHMFDVDLDNGEAYRESANYSPGDVAVVADLPWGRLGLTICYDLRFPSLYRALAEAGAAFLTVPAAFTRRTGEAHWHTLLRARAIETGCFVMAAAQGGRHENGRETFGHSLIIDPWGTVLAEGGTEPGVVMATIDPAKVTSVRRSIPSLQHGRRFTVIEPVSPPSYLHLVRGKA
jgi:predicted amidohydrolase